MGRAKTGRLHKRNDSRENAKRQIRELCAIRKLWAFNCGTCIYYRDKDCPNVDISEIEKIEKRMTEKLENGVSPE